MATANSRLTAISNQGVHIVYTASDGFWGGKWHAVEMYPTVPPHVSEAMSATESDEPMIP